MLSLSTSFMAGCCDNGKDLVAAIEAFGAPGVELEYRISEKLFHQMRPVLAASTLQVTSIHNFSPHPKIFAKLAPSGDLFSLSDTDRERRKLAVQWTQRTIEHANDLEARAVVLHCGRVDMTPDVESLYGFLKADAMETEAAKACLSTQLDMRDRLKPPHLDALCSSLDRLLGTAERHSVTLALENRFHLHELPGPDDFQTLFGEFRGAPLGYWHDTGHAHAAHLLTWLPPGDLPAGCADRLVGMHLHDARGLDDHLAPGAGDIDFNPLKPLVKGDIPLVMELKPGTPDQAVHDGLAHLRKTFELKG
ncbi:MAG: sugar phosphate isomerase/epimerase [Desulfobacterales bacterium]|nr:sugar phosphate isomerase/epimerase [Desulfobacterales bacterium]